MQVIVPKQGSNLQDLIRALENTTMETIRQSIREPGLCEKVRLHLPKFKIKSTLSLVEPLRKVMSNIILHAICLNGTNFVIP